jgi:hypothetical protein
MSLGSSEANRNYGKSAFLVGAALFVYLVLRAIYSPILHDEIATFYHYIQPGKFIPPDALWDANNHLLNSLLTWVSYQLFGSEPWALRLPNVLFFPLFFWAVFQLSKMLHGTLFRWSFLLAMTMAHYMFEYFGETRGYGLSMALLLAALYWTIRFFREESTRQMSLALVLLWLATSANLTLVYSFLLIWFAMVVHLFAANHFKKGFKLGVLVVFLLALYPLVWFAMELKHRGALYYGGKSGFWEYTGGTLTKLYTGYYSTTWAITLTIAFGLVVIGFLAINRKNLLKPGNLAAEPSTVWVYLLVGSISAIFATRYVLDVNFPEDRAAMYLYPYLIGSVVFVSNQGWKEHGKSIMAIPSLLLLFFPVNFVGRMNIHTATFSMEERAPQDFFEVIARQQPMANYPVIVGGAHTQELCWFFMNYQAEGKLGKLHYTGHLDTLCDFQIVDVSRKKPNRFNELYIQRNSEAINRLNLYERKHKPVRVPFFSRSEITNWNHSKDEFFGFYEDTISGFIKGKPMYVGVTATVHSPARPFVATLVVSQKDANYEEIHQEVIHLNWLRNKWSNSPDNLQHGVMLSSVHPEAHYLVVYLWNQYKVDFLLHDGRIDLFELKFESEHK